MTVKNILIAYNGTPSSHAALRGGLLMQKAYGGHVTGILAHDGSPVDRNLRAWMPEDVLRALRDTEGAALDAIREDFETRTAGAVAGQTHWIRTRGHADQTVADYARIFDITVVGQPELVASEGYLDLHPDRIAFQSGRPVLMVPLGFEGDEIPDEAVLAWDGQRAAARALADTMAILKTKKRVTILTVEDGTTDRPLPGINVETVLQRHGVQTDVVRLPATRAGTARQILEYCEDTSARLLVMGAYGQSMLREKLLGGTTVKILGKIGVPVLMAH